MRKLTFLLTFLLFVAFQASAQMQITGKVTNAESGEPIPGASVVVKSQTTIGTTTDMDGNYNLDGVPSDAETLIFSFVGMQEKEIAINGRTNINVELAPSVEEMEEVIVTAYGTKTKQSKTGALSVTKSAEFENVAMSSGEQALQGKISGVQFNSASGAPGASNEITIRGMGSINSSTQPLFVVDGVPVSSGNYSYATTAGNILSTINPSDIESMTVLNDASAASIYGSRAANGVILITTKTGSEGGETNISFRAEGGMSTPSYDNSDFRFMNAEESLEYWRTAAKNAGIDPDDPTSGQYYLPQSTLDGNLTNWWNEVYQSGETQRYELSARGGDKKTQFYVSGSYYDQQGIQISSYMERFSGRVNIDHQVSDKLSVGVKATGTFIDQADNYDGLAYGNPFWAASSIFPWNNPKNPDGTWNWSIPENSNSNPVALTALNDRYDLKKKAIGQAYIEYDILPTLTFKTTNNVDYYISEGRDYRHPETPEGEDTNGYLYQGFVENQTLTTSNLLTYKETFSEVHNVEAKGGFEAQEFHTKQYDLEGAGMGADIPYLSNTASNENVGYGFSDYSVISYFGTVDYNFNTKYFVFGSLRADGSSRFGEDNRWALFPSVGASWNIHREAFMNAIEPISMLKLRLSYGTSGNWEIGNYEHYGLYGSRKYNNRTGLAPNQIANPALTWETSESYNIGLDFELFDMLEGTFEYYNKTTKDMLLDVPVSRTTGFANLRQNVGSLENKGVELELTANIMDTRELQWNVGLNITHNVTNITDLAGQEIMSDGFFRRHRVGKNTFSEYYVYDWAGVNPVNGHGLWYDEDGNLTQNFANARRVFESKIQPDYYGGFSTDFSWKGFNIAARFEYKVGQAFMANERRYTDSDGFSYSLQTTNLLDYWKEPGQITGTPKPIAGNTTQTNAWGTSRILEKGDYLRFKELRVSYNLPQDIIETVNLKKATVYVSGTNIYTWHDVSYWDPERGTSGGGYAIYPNPTTINLGVQLDF